MARKNSGPKLKRLRDQVIAITGASSGIGLATARVAAERGARVVMSSRNEEDLRSAVEAIRAGGGRATYCVADVADAAAVDRIGETALREFGGLDTWVNNAGVSIYGRLTQIPMEDKKRLFETNLWGVVKRCRTAGRLAALAPRLTDLYMERTLFDQMRTNERSQPREGSLERPQRDGRTQGPYRGHVMKSSAYTRAVLSDVTRALPLLAAGVVFAAGARKFRGAA